VRPCVDRDQVRRAEQTPQGSRLSLTVFAGEWRGGGGAAREIQFAMEIGDATAGAAQEGAARARGSGQARREGARGTAGSEGRRGSERAKQAVRRRRRSQSAITARETTRFFPTGNWPRLRASNPWSTSFLRVETVSLFLTISHH
jgi:hypothetical protein